jgi:thiosulfate/3-mercaptopyruvate sulfurtransferase
MFVGLWFVCQSAVANGFVSSDWLNHHLQDPDLLLIDMDDGTQYQRFHLPGAVHLPYGALNIRTRQGVSLSVGREHLIKLLGLLGATADSRIVIYDDLGGLNAGRLYWELERLGHRKLAVLDGGLVGWILEGHKVTNQPRQPERRRYVPAPQAGRDNLASLDDIRKLPPKAILLDARSEAEYRGDPRQPRSGHIPGARWWEWTRDVDFEHGFRLKPATRLKATLAGLGLNAPDTPVYVYCESGHRASQVYFTLRQLGFDKVRVYDGSMAEYRLHKDLPLVKGMKPE